MDSVEFTWLGPKGRTGRCKPLYKIELWNKWEEITSEDFATINNGSEVFNSTWNPSVPKSASIWTVIYCFKKEEALAQITFMEDLWGVHDSHNRSRDDAQQEKMRQLCNVCTQFDQQGDKQAYLNLVVYITK